MHRTLPADRIAAGIEILCTLIARHGYLRRLAGPLVVLIWQIVRTAGAQAGAVLARMQAGTLRRYPLRRPPRPSATPRRGAQHGALPRAPAWLVKLIPETAASAAQLQNLLAQPDVPALLVAAPQLRRALRPLCRMLGVPLPSSAKPALRPPATPPDPPDAPTPRRLRAAKGKAANPQLRRPSPSPGRLRPQSRQRAGVIWPPPSPVPVLGQ